MGDIIRGAVAAEKEFICEALPCALIGMNSSQMTEYIQFVADRLLTALGHPNFFEKRVGEYQKKGVMASLDGDAGDGAGFALDEDF